MTRRELLACAAATPALLGRARPVDRSRISVITDEAAKSQADSIAFAKQYGLEWLELRGVPGGRSEYMDLPKPELKGSAKLFAGNGLKVSFLDSGLFKYTLPGTEPARRERNESQESARRDAERFKTRMDEVRRAINAAQILGTDKIRVFAFRRVREPLAILPRIVDILGPMVELGSKEKVRILIENEGSCNVGNCAELAEIARLLPSKWFGINWDSLNGASAEKAFPDGYSLLPKDRIGNVHIKGRSVLPGPQKLDWAEIFDTASKDGYTGTFGLETHIFGPGQIQASHDCMKAILRIVERS